MRFLRDRQVHLGHQLAEAGNYVEYTFEIGLSAMPMPAEGGKAYFLSKFKAYQRQQEEMALALALAMHLQQVLPSVRHTQKQGRLHLGVPKQEAKAMLDAAKAWRKPDMQISCTGPWPPHHMSTRP
jgi:hypothetical protein